MSSMSKLLGMYVQCSPVVLSPTMPISIKFGGLGGGTSRVATAALRENDL